jgi:hypothetical protein
MSTGTAGPAGPLVLRQSNTMLVPVAVWIFCVGAVVDAVVEGTGAYVVHVVLVMALIAFAAWMLLASPCLVVERDGLRIVNPLRVHRIPFAAIDAVRVRGLTSVTARAAGGLRTVTSWNAPGQPRRYAAEVAPIIEVIERARSAWESRARKREEEDVLTTTWRLRPALVLAALLVANIAIWFR